MKQKLLQKEKQEILYGFVLNVMNQWQMKMNKKHKIDLTESEVKITADIHKKIMETIAENCNFASKEKEFHVITLTLAITVCNVMSSFGIDHHRRYLDDFCDLVKQLIKPVKQNSSYMEFKGGKKVSEGRFN